MPSPSRAARTQFSLEHLELRENPAGVVQTFDTPAGPDLPAGWAEWSNNGSDVFSVVAGQGVNGSAGVVSSASSRTAGLAWQTQAVSGDTGAAAVVKLDTLVPTFVFARGSNLGTTAPSYLAAVVTRGTSLSVWEVTNGSTKVLASVTSPAAAYFAGGWARVSLVPTGSTVAVQVVRQDTGEYLNAQGTWQSAATAAITTKTTIASTDGNVGIGRPSLFWGPVQVDNFEVLPPPAPPTPPPSPPAAGVTQTFDTTAAGAKPAGWSAWATDSAAGFAASLSRALDKGSGFASSSTVAASAARAWADAAVPADVEASAAVYLDSLIPAQVFVRGSNLDTAAPTYYAVTVTRGLEARLVKVVNGVETVLGTAKSSAYFSSQWLRVKVAAEGDRLRVTLYRTDTRQWLTATGGWTSSPDYALDLRDGSITAAGKAGVGRGSKYSGMVTFDDFEAKPAGGSNGLALNAPASSGSSPAVGDVTFRATGSGPVARVEFRLNDQVRGTSTTLPAEWTFDTTTIANGTYTLTVRAIDAAGNIVSRDVAFTVANPDADPVPKPTIPRHYSHIRIAQLAYSGNPMGTFEQNLLKNSVDVVIPNTQYLSTIDAASSATPQLIYSNVSNLYQDLLTDWLAYADRAGVSRELAFYHVSQATAFTGSSPSSQPVNWFWGVYQSNASGGAATDVTSAARGGRNFNVSFGAAGQTTAVGYLEKYREMNITLATTAAAGWSGVWEYVSAVDATGKPTAWKTLTAGQDGTAGLTRSGTITFDPPADWKAASVGGSSSQYFVRFRATSGTAAQAAQLKTIFGRDYVRADGKQAGTIPAFDAAADKNKDGYLDDAEYAGRSAGMDARFAYESRLFYPYYGQMRFVTNPSASAVRKWAADYHVRLMEANPKADGVFMDNAHGKLPFAGVPVLETTSTYSDDSGALVGAVNRAVAPKWVMANTAGARAEADAVAARSGAVIEEFLLRPLKHNWSELGDAANLVAMRLAADGSPYVVLDSSPDGGSPTDARTQLATLAYYYLLADADRTMLMFYGGSNPSSSWTEHWSPAAAVDVGRPAGAMQVFATGKDPLSPSLTYKVFSRTYENALVLYKPLSYAQGVGEGTLNTQTATTHLLNGNYRRVNADGTIGPIVSSVSLRNGEGAVLVKV